jgi:prepilin-type processing-associated H-X9-DG protein
MLILDVVSVKFKKPPDRHWLSKTKCRKSTELLFKTFVVKKSHVCSDVDVWSLQNKSNKTGNFLFADG